MAEVKVLVVARITVEVSEEGGPAKYADVRKRSHDFVRAAFATERAAEGPYDEGPLPVVGTDVFQAQPLTEAERRVAVLGELSRLRASHSAEDQAIAAYVLPDLAFVNIATNPFQDRALTTTRLLNRLIQAAARTQDRIAALAPEFQP